MNRADNLDSEAAPLDPRALYEMATMQMHAAMLEAGFTQDDILEIEGEIADAFGLELEVSHAPVN